MLMKRLMAHGRFPPPSSLFCLSPPPPPPHASRGTEGGGFDVFDGQQSSPLLNHSTTNSQAAGLFAPLPPRFRRGPGGQRAQRCLDLPPTQTVVICSLAQDGGNRTTAQGGESGNEGNPGLDRSTAFNRARLMCVGEDGENDLHMGPRPNYRCLSSPDTIQPADRQQTALSF